MAGVIAVVVAAAAYGAGVRRLARRGRRWPPGRSLAFAGGAAVLLVVAVPPLAGADDRSLTVHVVEHLVLGMAAPLLLALSAPVTLALQASSRPRQRALLAVLHSRPVILLTNPLVAVALFVGSMFVLYLTPLLEASVEHGWLHALVHLHFFAVGCLFFWPLVSPDPVPHRLPYPARLLLLLLTVPAHAVLGLTLMSASSPLASEVYPVLGNQRTAGGVLWVAGDLLGLLASGIVLAQWMRADERAAAREDRESATGPAVV